MSEFKQFSTPHSHPHSLDTASTPEAMAKRAKELGAISVCCTDHGTMAATVKMTKIAKGLGLISIPGIEAYFRDNDCPILSELGIPKTDTVPRGIPKEEWLARNPNGTFYDYRKYFHCTIHFKDFAAYKMGIKLLSKADLVAERHGGERKPLFNWSDLEELAAYNVTVGSSCFAGMVQGHITGQANTAAAEKYFQRMKSLFGDRYFVEVFPHRCTHNWDSNVYLVSKQGAQLRYYLNKMLRTNVGEIRATDLADVWRKSDHATIVAVKNYRTWEDIEPFEIAEIKKIEGYVQNECAPWAPDGDLQWGANKFVLALAKKYGVKTIISDDSHFATPDYKIVQDIKLSQFGNWKMYESYHMQSSDEAWAYFSTHLQVPKTIFEGWIDNSLEWATGFKDFRIDAKPSLPTKFFPSDSLAHTRYLIQKHGRMRPEYRDRLKQEIEIFHNNGTIDLLPYFWIDEEVCRLYRDCGELTGPGRGSAAGALLSYLLGITHIDPLRYGLSLERFLTKDRINSGKMPDIDQDLSNRDLLVGGSEIDTIRFEASDGTIHEVPASFRVDTGSGEISISEAIEKDVDFREWWR